MGTYRKKPVEIQAEQWFTNVLVDGVEFITPETVRVLPPGSDGGTTCGKCGCPYSDHGVVGTLEGLHLVCPGDFIITGVQGEKYPCKPDIFEETYDYIFG